MTRRFVARHTDGTLIAQPKEGKHTTDITDGIWNLYRVSEGHYAPSYCREIALVGQERELAERISRAVLPTMGVRLFYGLDRMNRVVEITRHGRMAARDIRKLWKLGVVKVWASTFTAPNWVVYGEEKQTAGQIDLSPLKTAVESARWGRALRLS